MSQSSSDSGALAAARDSMMRVVRDQVPGLSPRILAAMRNVPRHEFVPEPRRAQAYADGALPIGHEQTISQPCVVAHMTAQLDPKPTDRILEIGTGSGYQAAILAELVAEVYTIEIIEPLAQRAATTLRRLGYQNVVVRRGDGSSGWPEAAPFDAIIVTCAPENIPRPLVAQLKDGGRIIIPIGPREWQDLVVIHKQDDQLQEKIVLPVRFVPMTGAIQN